MANGEIYPVVKIDWDADGSFATSGDDISADVMRVTWRRGIYDRFDQMGRVGSLDLILKNVDKNYSPEYSSGTHYGKLLPGREFKLQMTDGTTTWDAFRGVISRIEPVPGVMDKRQAIFKCECTLGPINRAKDLTLPVMYDVTVDDVLERIGSAAYRTDRATGTITVNSVPGNGEMVKIGEVVYTLVSSAPAAPYEVLIGASAAATAQNITDAINTAATASTTYGANTEKHPDVSAAVSGATITLTAVARGTWGNAIELSAGWPQAVADDLTLTYGSVGSGSLSDTYTQNAVYYQLDESASGLVGYIDFIINGIGTDINIYGYYSAAPGEVIYLYLYNAVDGTYRSAGSISHSATPGNFSITLPPSFTSPDGDVRVWFINGGAGNPAYDWYLDRIYVNTDEPEVVGNISVSGSTLSGGTDGPAGLMNYDTGTLILNIVGNQWDENTTGYQAMRSVVESEPASLFWVAADGTLVFKNKDWIFQQFNTAASMTIDDTSNTARGALDWDEVVNRVDVKYTIADVTASGVIAKANSVVSVPGQWGIADANRYNPSDALPEGGTGMVMLPFVDQGTGRPAGVASIILPLVPGTDYDVFDDADGNGYDYTSSGLITINAAVTSRGVELQIQNAALGTLYLHNLQVRGVLYVMYDSQHALIEDTDSQDDYGLQSKTFDLPYASSQIYNLAPSYGQWLIGANKDPIYRVETIEFLGKTIVGGVNIFSLDIGDLIDYSESQTEANNFSMLITAINGDWQKGRGSKLTFMVRRVDDREYWILGTSVLGSNTLPGI